MYNYLETPLYLVIKIRSKNKNMAKKLFIGNLSFNISEEQLKDMFSPYGSITNLNIVKDKFSGRSKGFAFVEFTTEEEAAAALAGLDGSEHDGRNIGVKEALPRTDKEN